ncbi:MAG: hypothetical protein INR69_16025 [Mucilaginibacter polytrichastri]|nr:hypothetical protein [Mucilaginibacter polytrichastri]
MPELFLPAEIGPFLGRFHPVLVHLPIGILLLAIVLHVLSAREKYAAWRVILSPAYLFGAASAVFSCITGFLLSQEGGYPDDTLSAHQWLGISVAVVSVVLFILQQKQLFSPPKIRYALAAVLFLLLTVTGHLGGSLTHGDDYLTEFSPFSGGKTDSVFRPKPIPDLAKAVAYTDVIDPILHQKCYSCHSSSKQKGTLRMDGFELLMKGGKSGPALEAGNAKASEMMKRIALPVADDKHMPPKEKPQLSKDEIALLHWWIEKGADRGKTIATTDTAADVKKWIVAWQASTAAPAKVKAIIPEIDVPEPDQQAVKDLQAKGVVVLPAGKDSHFLSLNFVNVSKGFAALVPALQKLKQQIVWLKAGRTDISDQDLGALATFPNLTRLHLENTAVGDAGVAKLAALKQLEFLNLVGTKTKGEGVLRLSGLKKLREVYLYQTPLSAEKFNEIRAKMPRVKLDTGGYQLPLLSADTTVLKK